MLNTATEYSVGPDNKIGRTSASSSMVKFLESCVTNATTEEDRLSFSTTLATYKNVFNANLLSYKDHKVPTVFYLGNNCARDTSFAYTNYSFNEPVTHLQRLDGDGTVPYPYVVYDGIEYEILVRNVPTKKRTGGWQASGTIISTDTTLCTADPLEDLHLGLVKSKTVVDKILSNINVAGSIY